MSSPFTSFTFTYNSLGNQYELNYSLTTSDPSWSVTAYINDSEIGLADLNQSNGTISIPEATYPTYFTQGYTIRSYLAYSGESGKLSSSNIYGVFQRATDSNNISINGNTKYVYAFKDTNHIKSIILPPISQSPCCTFFLKYLGQQKPASVCAYMSNISYPITTSVFTPTVDNTFSGIFDSKLSGSYQSIVFETSFSNSCLGCYNNTSNWYYTSIYYSPNSNLLYGTSSDQTGALLDASNSQILVHEYVSQSTIVMCNSPPTQFPKFIFFRKTDTLNTVTVKIFAPPGVSIDSTTPTGGDSAYVSYNITQYQQRTVGFYYNQTDNIYYVLTNYNSSGLSQSMILPVGGINLSNAFGLINDEDKDIKLTLPVEQAGYAKINTIAFIEGASPTSKNLYLLAPSSGNAIVLTSVSTAVVQLANSGTNIAYTFGTFYNAPTSNYLTIPLYNSDFNN